MQMGIKFNPTKKPPRSMETVGDCRYSAVLQFLKQNNGKVFESKKELGEAIKSSTDVGFNEHRYAVSSLLTKAKAQGYVQFVNTVGVRLGAMQQ